MIYMSERGWYHREIRKQSGSQLNLTLKKFVDVKE